MQNAPNTNSKIGIAGFLTKATIKSPLTLLLLLAAFAVGFMALLAIPREEEPQISVPMVNVQIPAPGLSANAADELITTPVEAALRAIDGVEHVYSQAQDNGVMLTARFLVGTSYDAAVLRVQQKMQEPNVLPANGAGRPIITARGIDDVPILVVTVSANPKISNRWSDAALYEVAQDIKSELTKVQDVGTSFIVGGRPHELRITPDSARLLSNGVALGSLIEGVKSKSSSIPIGSIKGAGATSEINVGSSFNSLDEVANISLSTINGNKVLLRDVADVEIAPRNDQSAAFHFERLSDGWGKVPTVAIAIAKRPGVNAVVLTKNVRARLGELKGTTIPNGIDVKLVRDYGETANEKANELLFHLGLATISIVALIFFTIGRRESVVTLIVIPTTILLTLFASNSMGFTINRVSLFALIFSIGILVDDAIVIIENIARHWAIYPNKPRMESAIDAVAEVGNPTIVATLTVVVALLPMKFVSGLMGPYMAPIPINASAAMIFSFFVAVIIAPWLMLKLAPKSANGMAHHHHESEGMLGSIYRKVAAPIIKSRKSAWNFLLIVGVATIGVCFLFYTKTVTVKLLPFDNKSEFQIVLDMPEGSSLEATQRTLLEAANQIGTIPEVETMQAYAGTSAPFNFNGLVRHYFLRDRPEMGDLQVNLTAKHHRKRASHEIALEAREKIAKIALPVGASLKVVEVPPGPPVISTLLAEVYGPDETTRRATAIKLKELLAKLPYIVDIDDYYGVQRPRLNILPNRSQIESLGIDEGQVINSIAASLGGAEVGTYLPKGGRDPMAISISLPESQRSITGSINSMPVAVSATPNGLRLATMGETVRIENQNASYPIFRRDGKKAEMVTADLAGQYESPIYGILDTNKAIKKADWGNLGAPQISWHGQPKDESKATILWDGEWEITYVTFRDMGAAFGVAILGIYILVVAQFGSFRLPLVVLTPIPLTLIGIVIGHAIFGAPFSATSMIGFIALAGIIVRNSILLIDFIRHAQTNDRPLREVLLEAGATRFKPIILTAVAAMIGAVVILGDPIFQGLAISLLFGLLSSTLLTVLVIPAIYIALRDDGKTIKD